MIEAIDEEQAFVTLYEKTGYIYGWRTWEIWLLEAHLNTKEEGNKNEQN